MPRTPSPERPSHRRCIGPLGDDESRIYSLFRTRHPRPGWSVFPEQASAFLQYPGQGDARRPLVFVSSATPAKQTDRMSHPISSGLVRAGDQGLYQLRRTSSVTVTRRPASSPSSARRSPTLASSSSSLTCQPIHRPTDRRRRIDMMHAVIIGLVGESATGPGDQVIEAFDDVVEPALIIQFIGIERPDRIPPQAHSDRSWCH